MHVQEMSEITQMIDEHETQYVNNFRNEAVIKGLWSLNEY